MRSRDIKPGFYLNEQLAECSAFARLVYPGLWMLADREGRLEYRPKRIKAELLPYDCEDMAALVGELEAQGLVKRYAADGKEYLWIPAFSRHQSPHPNEKRSVFPPCPEALAARDESASLQGGKRVPPESETAADGAAVNPASSLSPSSPPPEEDTSSLRSEVFAAADGDAPPPGPCGHAAGEVSVCGDAGSQSPLDADRANRKAASGRSAPPCPYEQIRNMYHAAFPEHPRVALLNAKRKGAVKARWGDAGQRLRALGRPDSAAERLAYFQRLFAKAAESDFLTGKRAFRDGSVYRVDFDKLMSPGGFVGVIEGKYDNREQA